MSATKSRARDLRRVRRSRPHACWDHLVVAPLWVAYKANLGTLLRTCDAVGACMAVPDTEHYRDALRQGWVERERAAGWRIVAVELAEGATQLPRLEPARERTVVLLGHERHGVPEELVVAADTCVEIPMVGRGASLNVAVAGSLVHYRLAGLA